MNYRFTKQCVCLALLFACCSRAPRTEAQTVDRNARTQLLKSVYTYKHVGPLGIQADVYRADGSNRKRPVAVWLHGGALIMGSRDGVPKQLRQLAKQHDFILVSLDYRLAPATKLPEIVDDLRDGIQWVRKSGPELFGADPSRLVVAGASAGGYLALMSGVVCEPPPTAIVSYWGFGDVDGQWTTKPNDDYRKGKLIDREAALAGVGQQVLANSNQKNGRGRAAYFLYLKQTGRWINEVGGFDPLTERDKITPFCPIRNVSADYPPTMFLHGTADKDVPVEQSIEMAAALERHGVARQLILVEGGGHSLWGGDRQKIEQAFQASIDYIHAQLVK